MNEYFIKAVTIVTLLCLAACADDPEDTQHKAELFCPNVAVLSETSQLDQFLPDRPDVTGQVTEAVITGVAGSCDLEKAKHAVKVTFKIGFDATNGPANRAKTLELPYFVSIVDGEDIISKNVYTMPITFDGNVSNAGATSKPVSVELPDERETGRIQVLVGFQLTPEQVAYAQEHPAR